MKYIGIILKIYDSVSHNIQERTSYHIYKRNQNKFAACTGKIGQQGSMGGGPMGGPLRVGGRGAAMFWAALSRSC